MKNLIINKDFLKQFDPCTDRWKNYLKYYSNWSGILIDFMYLENISSSDKIWVFSRNIKGLEKAQRKFAVYCMDRCQSDISEIQEFQLLVQIMYESVDYNSDIEDLKDHAYNAAYKAAYWAAYEAAYWAAYEAAYWAAYEAAYWAAYEAARAAERNVQIEIIKYVLLEDK